MVKKVADGTSKVGAGKDSASKEGSAKKSSDLNEEFLAIEAESVEFESEEVEVAPSRANQKDPFIRRKIEDLLERRRLREELGLYDDEAWEGL